MADVIIVGAGPAGTVCAALLGRLGYQVEIWERQVFPRHRIGESLPPRAVDLLHHLKFKAEGFAVMEGHTSIWGKTEPHRAVFQEGYGLQVQRDRFDQMLLSQSGAGVHFGRKATDLIKEDGRVVGIRDSDGGEGRARFVVMATGARQSIKHLRQSAVFGYWKNSRHPEGSQANDTIIESFPDGWVWSLRLADDTRNVTVLFDHAGTSYLQAIAQAPFVRKMLDGAELVSKPLGCDASWQCAETFAEPGFIRVGDAGSVIDPLSSQGVYKAFCSAMSAAVVINTCLSKPEMEAAAVDFFNEEEKRTYDGYSAGSVATFRAEQRWPDRPFWKTRHELSAWDIQAKPFDVELANAIESGRTGGLRLRNAPGTHVARKATMSGRLIEWSDYVVSPTFEYGYRGNPGETIRSIHGSLVIPKSVKDLIEEQKGIEPSMMLKVVAYMYREGLIETT